MTRRATPVLLCAFAVAATVSAACAQEPVDLELVLAADGSGSIDDDELRLQREGYARAVTNPQVLEAMTGGIHGRSAVAYVEWGAPESQHTIVDWTVIDGAAAAEAFAGALRTAPRAAWGFNSISNAIAYSQSLIEENSWTGLRRVIDVSADAGNIGGMPLALARANAVNAGITINGLAISREGSTRPVRGMSLEREFREQVIGGAGAFVVTVDETISFADAVLKKMILEVAGAPGAPGTHALAAGAAPAASPER